MFEGCNEVLLQHDAIVDKLMGDAVMAVFGAPSIREDHVRQAVEAADAIQAKAARMFPPGWEGACVRIGINSGAAFVGRVGSHGGQDYTPPGRSTTFFATAITRSSISCGSCSPGLKPACSGSTPNMRAIANSCSCGIDRTRLRAPAPRTAGGPPLPLPP